MSERGQDRSARALAATITRDGFTIIGLERFGFAPAALTPRTAHPLGRARLPQ